MLIYSDPHLGLMLGSNTTQESRRRLRDYIRQHTFEIVESAQPGRSVICSGDFFDKYQNPEEVLLSSLPIAERTHAILAGNHDVVNIKDRSGSLDVVSAVVRNVYGTPFGMCNSTIFHTTCRNTLYLVPHHSTQELFESALSEALSHAESGNGIGLKILVTHCNYDNELMQDKVALNLPKRIAAHLLKAFDFIVLGHEHAHRTDLNDRVIVVGSPHPVGFGDMGDKFVLTFGEDGPELHDVWSVNRNFLEVDYRAALDKVKDHHQFIRLTGQVQPAQLHELSGVIKDIWKQFSPFAVKSEVEVITGNAERTRFQAMSPDRLQAIIAAELESVPDQLALWKEITRDQVADA